MTVKMTLFFSLQVGQRTAGWSESYYIEVADVNTYIGVASLVEQQNILPRLNCLGMGVTHTGTRVSDAVLGLQLPSALRKNTAVFPGLQPAINSTNGLPYYNAKFGILLATPINAEFPQVSYNYQAQTGMINNQIYKRNFWLRGLPDNAVEVDFTRPKSGPVLDDVNTWKQTLLGSGFAIMDIRYNDRSANNPIRQCNAFAPATGNYTVPLHGFVQNQRVEAIGFRASGLNIKGSYKVTVVDANTITINTTSTAGPFTALGGFRAYNYVVSGIQRVQERTWGQRKAGRPFFQLVGRRVAIRTRRA